MGLHSLLLALQIAAPDSARLAALARFHPGATLRLQGSFGRVEAKLAPPIADSITVGRWRAQGRIPTAAVDSIWVLHSGVNKGAAAGAVVVGLTLGIFTAQLEAGLCESAHCNTTGAFLGGAGVGVIIGGTIGAIIGAADESWERIYP